MPTPGYVYVLANSAMPNYVKIGRTTGSTEDRAKAISKETGVPVPYIVIYESKVDDCIEAEKILHRVFEDAGLRLNKQREHFRVNPKQAIKLASTVEDFYPAFSSKYIICEPSTNSQEESTLREVPIGLWIDDQSIPLPLTEEIGPTLFLPKVATSRKEETIISLIRALSEEDNPDACYLMGLYYRSFDEMDANAIPYLRRGANLGNPFCLAELTWSYWFTQDDGRALDAFLAFLRCIDPNSPERALTIAYIFEIASYYFSVVHNLHNKIYKSVGKALGESIDPPRPFLEDLYQHLSLLRPYKNILAQQIQAQYARHPKDPWLPFYLKYIDIHI